MQGATEIALTKLDILSYMEKIPVCIAYEIDGKQTTIFTTDRVKLAEAKPVIEYVDGWKCDISGCRKKRSFPRQRFATSNISRKRPNAASNMCPSAQSATNTSKCTENKRKVAAGIPAAIFEKWLKA